MSEPSTIEPPPSAQRPLPGEPATADDEAAARAPDPPVDRAGRPVLERLGLAAIAVVITALFVVVAIVSFSVGDLFMAAMGAIGALMTAWAGLLTVVRG